MPSPHFNALSVPITCVFRLLPSLFDLFSHLQPLLCLCELFLLVQGQLGVGGGLGMDVYRWHIPDTHEQKYFDSPHGEACTHFPHTMHEVWRPTPLSWTRWTACDLSILLQACTLRTLEFPSSLCVSVHGRDKGAHLMPLPAGLSLNPLTGTSGAAAVDVDGRVYSWGNRGWMSPHLLTTLQGTPVNQVCGRANRH